MASGSAGGTVPGAALEDVWLYVAPWCAVEEVAMASCASQRMAQLVDRELVSALIHRRAQRTRASVKEFWAEIVPMVLSPLRAVRLYETTRAPFALPPLRAHDADPAGPPPPARRGRSSFHDLIANACSMNPSERRVRELFSRLPALLSEEPLACCSSDEELVNGMFDFRTAVNMAYQQQRPFVSFRVTRAAVRSLISCLRGLVRDPRAADATHPRAMLHNTVISALGSLLPPTCPKEVAVAAIDEGAAAALAPYLGGFASWVEQTLAVRVMSGLLMHGFAVVGRLAASVALDATALFAVRHPDVAAARGVVNPHTAPAYLCLATQLEMPGGLGAGAGALSAAVVASWPSFIERRRTIDNMTTECIYVVAAAAESSPRLAPAVVTPLLAHAARGFADSTVGESAAAIRVVHACAALHTPPRLAAAVGLRSGLAEHVLGAHLDSIPAGAIAAVAVLLQRLDAAGALPAPDRLRLARGPVAGGLAGAALAATRELARACAETLFIVLAGLPPPHAEGAAAPLAFLRRDPAAAGDAAAYAAAAAACDSLDLAARLPAALCLRAVDVRALRAPALRGAAAPHPNLSPQPPGGNAILSQQQRVLHTMSCALRAVPYARGGAAMTAGERAALPLPPDGGAGAYDAAAGVATASDLPRCRPLLRRAWALLSRARARLSQRAWAGAARAAFAAVWASDTGTQGGGRAALRALRAAAEALSRAGSGDAAVAAVATATCFLDGHATNPDRWAPNAPRASPRATGYDTWESARSPLPTPHEAAATADTCMRVVACRLLDAGGVGPARVARSLVGLAGDDAALWGGEDSTGRQWRAPPATFHGLAPEEESWPARFPAWVLLSSLGTGLMEHTMQRFFAEQVPRCEHASAHAGTDLGNLRRRWGCAVFARLLAAWAAWAVAEATGSARPLEILLSGEATGRWMRRVVAALPPARGVRAWNAAVRQLSTFASEASTAYLGERADPAGQSAPALVHITDQMHDALRNDLAKTWGGLLAGGTANAFRASMGCDPGAEALARRERDVARVAFAEMSRRFAGGLPPVAPWGAEEEAAAEKGMEEEGGKGEEEEGDGGMGEGVRAGERAGAKAWAGVGAESATARLERSAGRLLGEAFDELFAGEVP